MSPLMHSQTLVYGPAKSVRVECLGLRGDIGSGPKSLEPLTVLIDACFSGWKSYNLAYKAEVGRINNGDVIVLGQGHRQNPFQTKMSAVVNEICIAIQVVGTWLTEISTSILDISALFF